MFIPFGAGAYDNNEYGLPPVVLENLYAQAAPDIQNRTLRLAPTPGLTSFATGFTGTAGAIFQSDGILSGNIIAVTGTQVSSVASNGTRTTISGAVATGDLSPQFAATQTPELVVVAGGNTYTVGATVASFTWSGPSGDITSVDSVSQRHLYTEAGSGRLWISDAGDATTVTKFLTAENDPDELKAVKVVGNDIYLLGSRKTEVAYVTGDTTTPIAFRPGFVIDYGIKSSRSVTTGNGMLFFVGDDGQVYNMNGGNPAPIGTQPIADLIEALANDQIDALEMDYYTQEGHKFVILRIPGYGDMFYDITTQLWHRRKRLQSSQSGVGPVVRAFNKVYALDNVATGNTTIARLLPTWQRNYTEEIRRVATALVPIEDGKVRINRVRIEGQTGVGAVSGQGIDPQLMLRIALDGRTFGNEISRSLGKIGQYRHSIVYGPLGTARPGVVALEVAYADPVLFTMTGAVANPEVLV
jgi:hypothetical protein